jgi:hypothetical protein
MAENERKNKSPRRVLVRPENTRDGFRQAALRMYTALTGKVATADELADMESSLDDEFGPEQVESSED